ncbi:MAG: hypothetical protein RLZZ580_2171 [Cyanobacteriota bacterium]|jgi:alkylresorcinol/alkylpyrone synthase
MPYIIETATGFPEHYYPQEVLEVNIRNHCANLLQDYCLRNHLDFQEQTFFDLEQIHLAFGVLGAKEDHLYWSVYSL